MGFGSLTAAQQILVKLYMTGGPQYVAQMQRAGLATNELAAANRRAGAAMTYATKRSYLQNQVMFTGRRTMFYATLATAGLATSVIKLGFAYDSAMQQARVALSPILSGGALNKEMDKLFRIAALTPFNFKDTTIAFRQMYLSLKPFGIGLDTVNASIVAITDNLSATGKVSPANLNRVSVAISHMANIGYLTGQALNQLGRDGIQIQNALHKELGLTGEQMKNIASLRLSPESVLNAIIKYTESTKGLQNAALIQSNLTLYGSWATFKDLLSQAAGGAEAGSFGGIHKLLTGVNFQLAKFYRAGKPITITNIAEAIDKQLSPKTHFLLNLFIFFEYTLKGIVGTLYVFVKVIGTLFSFLDRITSIFGQNRLAAKLLGIAVGVLIGFWIVSKSLLITQVLLLDAYKFSLYGVRLAILAVTAAQKIQLLLFGASGAAGIPTAIGKYPGDGAKAGLLARLIPAISLATLGWIGLLIAAVGIVVVLYLKWKAFHDVVNGIAKAFWNASIWIKILMLSFGPLGWFILASIELAKHWKDIANWIESVYHWLTKLWSLISRGAGWLWHVLTSPGAPTISGIQSANADRGGISPNAGGQSIVTSNQSTVAPLGAFAGADPNQKPIHVQLVVDRKVLAQTVARADQDYASRR